MKHGGTRANGCRWCRKQMRWERTTKGRPMPLDPEPSANGNVLLQSGDDNKVVAIVLGKAAAEEARARGIQLYVAHFATCTKRPKDAKKKGARS